ncbi:MAG: response regulator [Candidatus Aureabacteria bacterium]|nr:response regulator [Candidatus Auribacterota bacterium]
MFRRKVEIIDDSPEICDFLTLLFKDKGYEVVAYTSATQAMKTLKEDYPAVLFVDYLLPDTDGIKIIKKAKKSLKRSKIIMLTGKGSEMVAVAAMKAGANDYIKKPIDTNEILKICKKYMDEFYNELIYINTEYEYPVEKNDVSKYEFLRALYSGEIKNIKLACKFFKFNRQDFYILSRRFMKYGPAGLLHQRVFNRIRSRIRVKTGPYKEPTCKLGLEYFVDPNDYVQKKLEMVRKAATDRRPNISKLCKEYNLTREAFYQIYKKFNKEGILGLIDKKKGRPPKNKDIAVKEEAEEAN